MLETKSVHLVARLDGVGAVHEADKGKALGHAGFSVLCQKHSGDASEALKHVAQLALLGHFRNLFDVVLANRTARNDRRGTGILTLVTRNVAKSSLSPYFDPATAPAAAAPPRRAGGTYDPFFAPGPPAPAGAGSSPIPAATSAAPFSPMGAMVSLYGHLAVKCSPLQIRHLTCLSFSLSFMAFALASLLSSLASLRQLTLGRKIMFSPTEVVSAAGPAPSLPLRPNLVQVLRSATRGLTFSVCVV